MPKKLSQTAITRLSQADLLSACGDWGIEPPEGALDLELRALLARAIVGGVKLLPVGSQPKAAAAAKACQGLRGSDPTSAGQNPFEEFEQPLAEPKQSEPKNLGLSIWGTFFCGHLWPCVAILIWKELGGIE